MSIHQMLFSVNATGPAGPTDLAITTNTLGAETVRLQWTGAYVYPKVYVNGSLYYQFTTNNFVNGFCIISGLTPATSYTFGVTFSSTYGGAEGSMSTVSATTLTSYVSSVSAPSGYTYTFGKYKAIFVPYSSNVTITYSSGSLPLYYNLVGGSYDGTAGGADGYGGVGGNSGKIYEKSLTLSSLTSGTAYAAVIGSSAGGNTTFNGYSSASGIEYGGGAGGYPNSTGGTGGSLTPSFWPSEWQNYFLTYVFGPGGGGGGGMEGGDGEGKAGGQGTYLVVQQTSNSGTSTAYYGSSGGKGGNSYGGDGTDGDSGQGCYILGSNQGGSGGGGGGGAGLGYNSSGMGGNGGSGGAGILVVLFQYCS